MFERNGEAMLAPLEGDVMRWMDGYVEHRGRGLEDRVRARHELAGATGAGGVARAGAVPGRARRVDVRTAREPAVRHRPLSERALPAKRAWRCGSRAGGSRTRTRSCARSQMASRGSPTSATSAPRRRATCSPTCRPPAARRCCARRSRSRSAPTARRSWRSAWRWPGAPTARSACTVRSAISCRCSCSTCPASARGSPATTTR